MQRMGFLVKRAIWEQPGNWRLWTPFDRPCTHANETFSLHERIQSARLRGFPQGTTPTLAKSFQPRSPWRSILKWVSHGKHYLTLASKVCKAVLQSFVLDPQLTPQIARGVFWISFYPDQQTNNDFDKCHILKSWCSVRGAQNKDFDAGLQTDLIRV